MRTRGRYNRCAARDLAEAIIRTAWKWHSTHPQGYASAAELADDVRRFLTEQPIAARPPSLAISRCLSSSIDAKPRLLVSAIGTLL